MTFTVVRKDGGSIEHEALSDELKEGAIAKRTGRPRSRNPYKSGCVAKYMAWSRGWDNVDNGTLIVSWR